MIVVFIYFCWKIITTKEREMYVLLACAYFTGAEVFFRMTKAFIFYETGKYAIMWFSLMGIFFLGFKKNAFPYVLYLLLLLPGVLVSFDLIAYDSNFRTAVLFNLSGPLCLSTASVFVFGRTITMNQFLKVMDYIIYPLISTTIYIVLYSPDIREIITSTASNSAVSGGYGPNQVATVLGLGIFLLLTRLIIPYKNSLVQWTMMFFMILMSYRALLTFSRGGVLVAIVMSVVFIVIFYFSTNLKNKAKISLKMIGLFVVAMAIWFFTVLQTGGLIGNRYANQDALGREKDDITTGRVDLLETEIDAFKKSPILGVGVGRVKTYFEAELGIELPSHNELSRMLSEHGLFGIFALLVLLFSPLITKMNGRKNIYFYPFIIFWGLTIAHSSMRIAAPAFIYALCLLNLDYAPKKNTALHRK
ncbi:MAG TPA: O-antigen ligase family protein [Flavobacteriaceae bacterium]|nr:O-antigen ligase family protein [Flavobacteriaceae bacterium]